MVAKTVLSLTVR